MTKREKHYISIDMAIKPSWWKKFLVWFGIKKRDWDYTCMIIWKEKNGIRTIKNIKYL